MSISSTIESYRKRRRRPPTIYIIGIVALILVAIGIFILIKSLTGGALAQAFATKTPTPTITSTPTNTPQPSETPTITETSTITETPTQSTIFRYTVQEGDTLTSIVKDQNLGDNGLILIYILNPPSTDPDNPGIDPFKPQNLQVGQVLTLPNPGMALPQPTPLPTGLANGSKISYRVLPGDSLGFIAGKFNTTPEAIVAANKTVLTDGTASVIYPGWVLQAPINLVTPVPTKAPTKTLTPLFSPTP